MSENRKQILIVEDSVPRIDYFTQAIKLKLGETVEILVATTLMSANMYIVGRSGTSEKPLSIVVMDGCLNSKNQPDTLPLIENLLKFQFKGPIIAMSAHPEFREKMMAAGCTHVSEKVDVPSLVTQLITEMG